MTKNDLLGRLLGEISAEEWQLLLCDGLYISEFNKNVLLEMRKVELMAEEKSKGIDENRLSGLQNVLEDYLGEHMQDKPEGFKWIIISSLYLTFIAERPMHPVDLLKIKIEKNDNGIIYQCPHKARDKNTACYYCVSQRMSNYEIMKRKMQDEFIKYDLEPAIKGMGLTEKNGIIRLDFIGRTYHINHSTGYIEYYDAEKDEMIEAGYNDGMTIFDILTNYNEKAIASNNFIAIEQLSHLANSAPTSDNGFWKSREDLFDNNAKALDEACQKLKGEKWGKGDISYKIPLFDDLAAVMQFWYSDEEFSANLQLLCDENILHFMHFETMMFMLCHLMDRITEEMATN